MPVMKLVDTSVGLPQVIRTNVEILTADVYSVETQPYVGVLYKLAANCLAIIA